MNARWIGAVSALALVFSGAAASAKTLHFATVLKGSEETPPNTTTGSGKLEATLDTVTKHFTYTVTDSGLTGPALAAHFHGPGGPGQAAGVALPVPKAAMASNPIKGEATLTDAQIADLEAGKWYFNIHTAANAGGEVRGQLPAEH
jgi:hypothetical protein